MIINNVRTRGKAGYRVRKFSGGQGDQDISLPLRPFGVIVVFALLAVKIFFANPFPIVLSQKSILTRTKIKGV